MGSALDGLHDQQSSVRRFHDSRRMEANGPDEGSIDSGREVTLEAH